MSRKPWQLTSQAYASMVEIGEWTKDHFGDRQADVYLEAMIAQCEAVSEGTAIMQSCGVVVGQDLLDDLRFTRSGQHFIVFVETETSISIVDFVHQREDLAGKVKVLDRKR